MSILPDPRLLLVGAVAALLLSGGAYIKGRLDGEALADAEHQKAATIASEKARDIEAKAASITVDVGQKHAEALAEIVVVNRIITREVPRYVTIEADRRCDVPAGFVSLHDAAAGGRVPEVSGTAGSPDDPSGVALSAVAATVAGNYGTCHAAIEQVKAWQEWWGRQSINGQ